MPGNQFKQLAMMSHTPCAYALLMSLYLCPLEGAPNKICIWYTTQTDAALVTKEGRKGLGEATAFLLSLGEIFEEDGAYTKQAKAAAVVKPGTQGY